MKMDEIKLSGNVFLQLQELRCRLEVKHKKEYSYDDTLNYLMDLMETKK